LFPNKGNKMISFAAAAGVKSPHGVSIAFPRPGLRASLAGSQMPTSRDAIPP
jgi:hypothetical protein